MVRVIWLAALAAIVGWGPIAAALGDEGDPVPVLPPIEIRAPRLEGPAAGPAPRAESALRRELLAFDVPASVSVREGPELNQRRLVRSMPDALRALPGVLLQKTAPMQSSPFIRGFTGYQNLLLIDGVRLNHSAFRAGPNQYWSTVDPYTIGRLEVVRGPGSVLYGSDALGGTVNVVTQRRQSFDPGWHANGRLYGRVASAEDMVGGRVEFEGNHSRLGWFGGISRRQFGDLESGGGPLPGTGGIDELAGDLRFDFRQSSCWTFTLAGQFVDQDDVPRTETTVFSVPFHGTVAGSELQRDHDQDRALIYARAAYAGGGAIERGSATVSWHRHEEERDRIRTGARQDFEGFDLTQWGVAFQLESRTRIGRLTYGAEWYRDRVDSFRRSFVAGVPGAPSIQGPVGDDATYDLAGVFVQDHLELGRFDVFAGLRFNYARADARRVDNPAVAGSDPATPGNVIRVQNEWTNLVGSLRALYRIDGCWHAYGGLSQGFRAPSLNDLTALDTTSVVESPAPDLKPERTLSFEAGVKTEQRRLAGDAALWYTLLDDAIIRSPTGALIAGVPEVRKDNIGDGYAWGVEASAAYRLSTWWTAIGRAGWMDSSVDEFDAATGGIVRSPLSRNAPFHGLLGLRLEPECSVGWLQLDWELAGKADRLSLRDRTDTRRIPPDGTPAWNVVTLRGGLRIGSHSTVTLAIENLFNENYRIHGSGQNEPGTNLVLGWMIDW
ncbi:MAG: TonB-dependent receptor [Planctomycetota bacterium]|nr:TonB-dependent receptor [Planctomycetota bacterium]